MHGFLRAAATIFLSDNFPKPAKFLAPTGKNGNGRKPANTVTRVLSAIKTSVSSRVADMMDHPHIPAASNLRMV